MITIPKICSRSLKYTVNAAKINASPKAKRYSTNITIGKKTMYQLIPIPLTISAINTITILNSIFIKAAFTTDIGIIALGKYTFLIKSFPKIMLVAPPCKAVVKKIQGINATNK